MKTKLVYFLIVSAALVASCNKSKDDNTGLPTATKQDHYTSMQDFYNKNGAALQTFNVDGATGGSFTTPQGTKVTVPSNTFVTLSGSAVTGSVKIEFKDVYKKSDMLLTDLSTIYYYGYPLKSGGMFFIKALQNSVPVKLALNKNIQVEQPFAAAAAIGDSAMQPFVRLDSMGFNGGWSFSYGDSLRMGATSYFFSFYNFQSPEDSGSWCNSDNSNYFSSYTQTTFKLVPTDNADTFQTEVFLVFKNVNSMVHVYRDYYPPASFPYNYAPVGLQCTVVAVGVRDSALYSSFSSATISANQTLYFTLSKTTTDEFKTQLAALN